MKSSVLTFRPGIMIFSWGGGEKGGRGEKGAWKRLYIVFANVRMS